VDQRALAELLAHIQHFAHRQFLKAHAQGALVVFHREFS
jgi:hypothetical protein